MSVLTYGLSSLMEAVNRSENAEKAGDALFEAFSDRIDEDLVGCLHGDTDPDDDSIDSSINGDGVGDNDKKMEELLDKIPPADEDIEERIKDLTESCLPEFIN